LKHFLYGAGQPTVDMLHKSLEAKLPGVDIVGTGSFTGKLSPEEAAELTDRVRSAAPDLVWVGLPTPQKDGFVAEYAYRFAATLVPVGRAFESLAGVKTPDGDGGLWRRHLLGNAVYYYGTLTDNRRTRRLDRLPTA
ncbi:MAG: WecB/TagA/CpsF family glycosyltransferase, partial [Stackebrandtia sp.]